MKAFGPAGKLLLMKTTVLLVTQHGRRARHSDHTFYLAMLCDTLLSKYFADRGKTGYLGFGDKVMVH